jgi:hypothetical protein
MIVDDSDDGAVVNNIGTLCVRACSIQPIPRLDTVTKGFIGQLDHVPDISDANANANALLHQTLLPGPRASGPADLEEDSDCLI